MTKRLACVSVITGTVLLVAQTSGPKTFGSPEDARDALVQAAAAGPDALKTLLGPNSTEILRTGDDVQDKHTLAVFNEQARHKVGLEPDPMNADRMTLLVGAVEWPFAVPLVRKDGRWYFDVEEGKAELSRRVIGGNELDTLEVCRGYVEAQKTYAETDWNGDGVMEYARKIISSEGKKDGLYWPGEDSPVAAGFAKAVAEGYSASPGSKPRPYHGYLYRVLLSQGPDAAGGAQDYLVRGLMIGGFALVAWPAEYGVSGIMTFVVNQDGVVYEKDLGPRTGALASAITTFSPDKSWRAVPDEMPEPPASSR